MLVTFSSLTSVSLPLGWYATDFFISCQYTAGKRRRKEGLSGVQSSEAEIYDTTGSFISIGDDPARRSDRIETTIYIPPQVSWLYVPRKPMIDASSADRIQNCFCKPDAVAREHIVRYASYISIYRDIVWHITCTQKIPSINSVYGLIRGCSEEDSNSLIQLFEDMHPS